MPLRILAPAAACLALSGCYVMQAARGQMQIVNAREPIGEVLGDPATPDALRQRLENVRAAREFAVRALNLPDNQSYRSYADIGREYVVWNVVATPEFSLEPREWCFPVAGCVAYRGYFRQEKAEAFAAKLRARGMDTVVEGVPAYSTLGRFKDPVLNTMLVYGDDELASILFHELSHQVVYIPDDSAFNEAFAVTVEQEGLARWLAARGRPGDLARHVERRARQEAVMRIVARYRGQLAALYAQDIGVDDMRRRKTEIFAALAQELREYDGRHGTKTRLAEVLAAGPNNARLASLATYYDCVPGFQRVLAEERHDLPLFYAAARRLAALPREERRARLCATVGEDS